MKNSDQSAFPKDRAGERLELTKREYFAGLAMQGYLSSHVDSDTEDYTPEWVAQQSIKYADELLKQLELTPKTN